MLNICLHSLFVLLTVKNDVPINERILLKRFVNHGHLFQKMRQFEMGEVMDCSIFNESLCVLHSILWA